MPRTRASAELRKRRAANLESYHRNADRHNKKRYCKRIATGAVSRMQLYTLEKYNMTPDDFNRIRTDNGLAPTLSQTTINNYITTMRRVVKVVMKCSLNDLVKCLREGDKVVRAIESRYTNSSTKRDYFNRIYSPSKYIPEYKAAIGEEALA
eukprot:jgi/Tetstr1/454901/TSEL_041765.t1